MVHGREIVEVRVPVRVRDAHIVRTAIEGPVHRQDLLAGKAVDGGEHGRGDETGIGQRQEIVVVVDQIELPRTPEGMRQVQPLPDLGVHAGRLLVGRGDHGAEAGSVRESAVANSVTSTPAATRPSVSSDTTRSHGP